MGRRFPGFVRAAVTDHRAADDYARLSGFGLCIGQRRGDGAYVSPFYPADDMPAVGLEPLGDILAKGNASVALDGDVVGGVGHAGGLRSVGRSGGGLGARRRDSDGAGRTGAHWPGRRTVAAPVETVLGSDGVVDGADEAAAWRRECAEAPTVLRVE